MKPYDGLSDGQVCSCTYLDLVLIARLCDILYIYICLCLLQGGQPTTPQLATTVQILRRKDTTQLESRPLPKEPRLIYDS